MRCLTCENFGKGVCEIIKKRAVKSKEYPVKRGSLYEDMRKGCVVTKCICIVLKGNCTSCVSLDLVFWIKYLFLATLMWEFSRSRGPKGSALRPCSLNMNQRQNFAFSCNANSITDFALVSIGPLCVLNCSSPTCCQWGRIVQEQLWMQGRWWEMVMMQGERCWSQAVCLPATERNESTAVSAALAYSFNQCTRSFC